MSELIPEPEPVDRDPAALAIALAGRGFAVFPLRPNAKTPAVPKDWEHAASTDPARLAALFRDRRANLAVACGPSRLIVIDLDVAKHGIGGMSAAGDPGERNEAGGPGHGMDVLRTLAGGREIPRTFTVDTPTGGQHLYFLMPTGVTLRNTAGRLGPLIDTRAGGGYVVAPGSFINGLPYRVTVDAPVAPLPDWIVEKLATPTIPPGGQPPMPSSHSTPSSPSSPSTLSPASTSGRPTLIPASIPTSGLESSRRPDRLRVAYTAAALRNEVERVHTAPPGTRNDTLNRAAYSLGRLIGAGLLDREEVTTQLQHAAHSAGLPPREIAATTRSGLAAGIAHPRIPLAIATRNQNSLIHGKVFEQTFFGETGPVGGDPATELDAAAWSETFGDLDQLHQVCWNLQRELGEPRTGPSVGSGTGITPMGTESLSKNMNDITTVLHTASDAQEDVGFAASALTQSTEWQAIRATTDALRDLLDELENGSRDYPTALRGNPPLNALIRTLVATACRQNARLAAEITAHLNKKHLDRSPVWSSLHNLRRVADNAAAFLDNQNPVRNVASSPGPATKASEPSYMARDR